MTDAENKRMIVGLYSFPKSGNTWLRAIIAGMTGMPMGPGVLQKFVTDTHYGKVLENPWSFQGTDWYFYKSHHKNVLKEHKGETFVTDKILHIYRHPLDVFLSYLNFVSNNVSPKAGESLNIKFDKVEDLTPEQMEYLFQIFLDHGTLFPKNKLFGSVFEHVENFGALKAKDGNVLMLRYEDLFEGFEENVAAIADFLGLVDIDLDAVHAAADKRTKQNGKFFWKRQRENFRNYLTDDQVNRFLTKYSKQMQTMGYPVD